MLNDSIKRPPLLYRSKTLDITRCYVWTFTFNICSLDITIVEIFCSQRDLSGSPYPNYSFLPFEPDLASYEPPHIENFGFSSIFDYLISRTLLKFQSPKKDNSVSIHVLIQFHKKSNCIYKRYYINSGSYDHN